MVGARISTREPARATLVVVLDLGAGQPRHVRLDVIADPGLQVGEVAVAGRESLQALGVEGRRGGRVDRVEAVLLIDRLALALAADPARHSSSPRRVSLARTAAVICSGLVAPVPFRVAVISGLILAAAT